MADCSKAIEFSRELHRLCEMGTEEDLPGGCSDACPFNIGNGRHTCPFDRPITQEDVDIVQKWSDEHQATKSKTYADDFFEKFPAASIVDGRPAFCRAKLYKTPCRGVRGNILDISANDCLLCWDEVME